MQAGYLGLIGGLTVKSCTAAILKAVMNAELACTFNFCGHHGKAAFQCCSWKKLSAVGLVCAFYY